MVYYLCMDAIPNYYIAPIMTDMTLNQFREKLSIEGAMELDKLIRWQLQKEIVRCSLFKTNTPITTPL